ALGALQIAAGQCHLHQAAFGEAGLVEIFKHGGLLCSRGGAASIIGLRTVRFTNNDESPKPCQVTEGANRPAEIAADALHSAAIRLLRYVRLEDAASGITSAQLSVLSVLVFGGPQTLGSLAAAEQV